MLLLFIPLLVFLEFLIQRSPFLFFSFLLRFFLHILLHFCCSISTQFSSLLALLDLILSSPRSPCSSSLSSSVSSSISASSFFLFSSFFFSFLFLFFSFYSLSSSSLFSFSLYPSETISSISLSFPGSGAPRSRTLSIPAHNIRDRDVLILSLGCQKNGENREIWCHVFHLLRKNYSFKVCSSNFGKKWYL